jgi:hypothetical protein
VQALELSSSAARERQLQALGFVCVRRKVATSSSSSNFK